MKVSKAAKAQTRRRLIAAAVTVIGNKGFRATTMRGIAKKAKVGEATIYKYFPSKELMVYAYFYERLLEVEARLKKIKNYHKFTLQEQLQVLFETELELYAPDKKFVEEACRVVLFTGLSGSFKELMPARELFSNLAGDLVSAAIESNEIPDFPFKHHRGLLFWEYNTALIYYWLGDESEHSYDTTQFIHRSLEIIYECLKSALLVKLVDFGYFVIRQRLFNHFFEPRPTRKPTKVKPKRPFMGETARA